MAGSQWFISHLILWPLAHGSYPQRNVHGKLIHGAAIYGAPWIPSIYPRYVSIFLPAPAGSYGKHGKLDDFALRYILPRSLGHSTSWLMTVPWKLSRSSMVDFPMAPFLHVLSKALVRELIYRLGAEAEMLRMEWIRLSYIINESINGYKWINYCCFWFLMMFNGYKWIQYFCQVNRLDWTLDWTGLCWSGFCWYSQSWIQSFPIMLDSCALDCKASCSSIPMSFQPGIPTWKSCGNPRTQLLRRDQSQSVASTCLLSCYEFPFLSMI